MSKNNNLSAVLYGVDDIRLENREIPPLQDHDVLLEMHCVGICGSDVHYWKHGRIADFVVKEPMVMGHESSGIVHKIGSKVKHLKPGDRVAIEPGVPCLRCDFCKTGVYNLCPDMAFCATPPIHGNMARYYVHCADFCYKLPDNVSLEEAALLEPLSVGVHACKRGSVGAGKTVLIMGSGPIGLVTLQAAKQMGASKIAMCSRDPTGKKLKIAREFGCVCTMVVEKGTTDEQFTKMVEQALGGPPDTTIDAAGFESTIRQGFLVTKPGGILVIIGMGDADKEVKIPLAVSLVREVDIRGIFRYANDYKTALSMVAKGNMQLERLITHKFKMEDVIKAFEVSDSGKAIKVMVYCNENRKL